MLNMLAVVRFGGGTFDLIHFLIGFVVLVCVLAVVIILVRWLASLAGVTIPPPLMLVLGILLFLLLFLVLLNWTGIYSF
jgi:hypothetical protein